MSPVLFPAPDDDPLTGHHHPPEASPRDHGDGAVRRGGRPVAVGLVGLALALAGCSAPRDAGVPATAETAQTAGEEESSDGDSEDSEESEDALTRGGSGDYEFEYEDQAIDVHGANHAQDPATAKILVVMHGTGRTADSYRDAFEEHVKDAEVIVLAPEFSDDDYDKAEDYQLGNLQDEDGEPLPPEESSFAVIQPMVEDAVRQVDGSQDSFSMFGHSAGGQFVHRYLAYQPGAPVDAAVAANAGWYMMPGAEGYPYGTQGSPVDVDVDRWLAQDMLVLLGEQDVEQDENLRDTPEAMAQGASRLARGKNFVDAGREAAAGGQFGWELQTVPDAGHDKSEMAPAALEYVLDHRQ